MINIIDTHLYSLIFKMFSIKTTLFMTFISYLGSSTTLISLSIMFIVIFKNKKMGLMVALNLIIVFLLNILIKIIVARPRPEVLKLVNEGWYSFPSGHTMVATGFYGLLIYIMYKKIKNNKVKYASIIGITLLILCIGISRIYLGVHFATDVIGGIIFGIIYLMIFIKLIRRIKGWKEYLQ